MPHNAEYSYPSHEELDAPTSPVEYICEELRTGGHGSQLRENIMNGLGSIYGNSPLVGSFRQYANTLARARKYSSSAYEDEAREAKPFRTHAFYAGSLLATHAMTQVLSENDRQKILRWWYGDEGAVKDLLKETERGMKFAATVLNAADSYPALFESQSEELQDTLMTAADHLFDDLSPKPRTEYENEFMFGYVFSANAVEVIYGEIRKEGIGDVGLGHFALP